MKKVIPTPGVIAASVALILLSLLIPARVIADETVFPDFATGYAEGLRTKRFIVVLFDGNTEFSAKMQPEFQRLREDPTLTRVMVFARSQLPGDQTGYKAAQGLSIKSLPAVSVFSPEPSQLLELSRFEGVYTYAEMRDGIVSDLCKAMKSGGAIMDDATISALRCKL
jgi:hypothetical protein